MRTNLSGLAAFGAALCAALVSASPPAVSAEEDSSDYLNFKSDYTKLDLDACERVDQSADGEDGSGRAHWRCAGLTQEWPVHVMVADDQHYVVSYGPDGPDEPAARQIHASFSRIHDTLEWVMEKKDKQGSSTKPIATILRFFLTVGEEAHPQEHPILVVTQLKPGAVCQIAYVDARANKLANLEARKAAYRLAGDFDCEADPELVGPQSPGIFAE